MAAKKPNKTKQTQRRRTTTTATTKPQLIPGGIPTPPVKAVLPPVDTPSEAKAKRLRRSHNEKAQLHDGTCKYLALRCVYDTTTGRINPTNYHVSTSQYQHREDWPVVYIQAASEQQAFIGEYGTGREFPVKKVIDKLDQCAMTIAEHPAIKALAETKQVEILRMFFGDDIWIDDTYLNDPLRQIEDGTPNHRSPAPRQQKARKPNKHSVLRTAAQDEDKDIHDTGRAPHDIIRRHAVDTPASLPAHPVNPDKAAYLSQPSMIEMTEAMLLELGIESINVQVTRALADGITKRKAQEAIEDSRTGDGIGGYASIGTMPYGLGDTLARELALKHRDYKVRVSVAECRVEITPDSDGKFEGPIGYSNLDAAAPDITIYLEVSEEHGLDTKEQQAAFKKAISNARRTCTRRLKKAIA
jgi:hypothetical protein